MGKKFLTLRQVKDKLKYPGTISGRESDLATKAKILEMWGNEKNLVAYRTTDFPIDDHIIGPVVPVYFGYVENGIPVKYKPMDFGLDIRIDASALGERLIIMIFEGYKKFFTCSKVKFSNQFKSAGLWLNSPCINGAGSCEYPPNAGFVKVNENLCYLPCYPNSLKHSPMCSPEGKYRLTVLLDNVEYITLEYSIVTSV